MTGPADNRPDDNDRIAAGGLFAAIQTALSHLDPQLDEDSGSTASFSVRLPMMRSRYQVILRRIPGTEQPEQPVIASPPDADRAAE